MLNINTNLSSLIIQSNLKTSTSGLNTAIERMTTGYKLNHAKDNAANYSIATSLTTKLGAYTVAEENAMMGMDMIQTASSSLSNISDKLSRMRALAMQAQNGTYGGTSLDAINAEANALAKEISRIYSSTEYNGRSLFKGSVNLPDSSVATYSSASATSSSTGYVSDLTPNSDGFIQDVVKRDTSAMTSISTLSDDAAITSGTYKIETKDDLLKFNTLASKSKIKGGEFVLANDIDMSESNYSGVFTSVRGIVFDGNGYKIIGLNNSLLWDANDSKFKNLGLENCSAYGAPLVGELTSNSEILNCYASNCVIRGGCEYAVSTSAIGGLVNAVRDGTLIENCWSNAKVALPYYYNYVGGLVGSVYYGDCTIKNSFFSGNISVSASSMAGLVGNVAYDATLTIKNCYSSGSIINNEDLGSISGLVCISDGNCILENCHTSSSVYSAAGKGSVIGACTSGTLTVNNVSYDASANPNVPLFYGNLDLITANGILAISSAGQTAFQVGINSDESSALSFSTSLDLGSLEGLDMSSESSLSKIDEALKLVNNKQTEFGAIQNRLESVLESIGVNINNLTSTRSTIKDADVAEISSEYIRNQILQQASATLLATANQNPSIALQLI